MARAQVAGPQRAGQAVVAVVGDADRVVLVVEGDDRQRPDRRSPRGRCAWSCRRRRRPRVTGSSPAARLAAADDLGPLAPADARGSRAQVSRWPSEIIGPISVVSSSGSPTRSWPRSVGHERPDERRRRPSARRGSGCGRSSPGRRCRTPTSGSPRRPRRRRRRRTRSPPTCRRARARPGSMLSATRRGCARRCGLAGEARSWRPADRRRARRRWTPPGPGRTDTAVGRHAGLDEDVAEQQRGERGERRRLEDDRVAAGQGRGELPGGDEQREVPRHDEAADADRLAQHDVEPGVLDRDDRAEVLVGGAGVVLEHVGRRVRLPAGVADRVAGVAGLGGGEGPRPARGAAATTCEQDPPRSVALTVRHAPVSNALGAPAQRQVDVGRAGLGDTSASGSPVDGSVTVNVAPSAARTALAADDQLGRRGSGHGGQCRDARRPGYGARLTRPNRTWRRRRSSRSPQPRIRSTTWHVWTARSHSSPAQAAAWAGWPPSGSPREGAKVVVVDLERRPEVVEAIARRRRRGHHRALRRRATSASVAAAVATPSTPSAGCTCSTTTPASASATTTTPENTPSRRGTLTMDVNVKGLWLCCKYGIPAMLEQRRRLDHQRAPASSPTSVRPPRRSPTPRRRARCCR